MRPAEPSPRPRLAVTTVGALVLNRSGEALFVRSPKWNHLWAVPGGKVEWGEPLHTALVRELREETGLCLADVSWAPTLEHVRTPDFRSDAHFVLLNFYARTVDDVVILNDEATAHRWLRPEVALRALDLNVPTRRLVLSYLATGGRGRPLDDHVNASFEDASFGDASNEASTTPG